MRKTKKQLFYFGRKKEGLRDTAHHQSSLGVSASHSHLLPFSLLSFSLSTNSSVDFESFIRHINNVVVYFCSIKQNMSISNLTACFSVVNSVNFTHRKIQFLSSSATNSRVSFPLRVCFDFDLIYRIFYCFRKLSLVHCV